MNLRPLVFDKKAATKIADLKAWANRNQLPLWKLRGIMEGFYPPPGDENSITLEVGYRVVFSIEEHPGDANGTKWCNHLSVSVSCDRDVWPSKVSVAAVAKEFGMDFKQCFVYLENEDNDDFPSAVNLIQPI